MALVEAKPKTTYTLKVASDQYLAPMRGLDNYAVDHRIETLREWFPDIAIDIEIDPVQQNRSQ